MAVLAAECHGGVGSFCLCRPAVCGIANIMLANNICDVDDDMENKRYTLPIYIGKEKALWLFETLYYIAFVDIIILAVFRIVSPIVLLTLLVFIPVRRNIGLFRKKQTRRTPLNLLSKILWRYVVRNLCWWVFP